MALAIERKTVDDQVIQLKVSWDAYEALVADLGDESSARLTYDGQTLEIMSPGSKHERIAYRISYLLSSVVTVWNFNIEGTRSTTFKTKPQGGFEGDESYYLANAAKVHDFDNIDLAIDPPPDLVIEVDITHRRMDKDSLYARIGVPEFWRYDDASGLEAFALEAGAYIRIDISCVIPGLPLNEVDKMLKRKDSRLRIVSDWEKWLRENRDLHLAK